LIENNPYYTQVKAPSKWQGSIDDPKPTGTPKEESPLATSEVMTPEQPKPIVPPKSELWHSLNQIYFKDYPKNEKGGISFTPTKDQEAILKTRYGIRIKEGENNIISNDAILDVTGFNDFYKKHTETTLDKKGEEIKTEEIPVKAEAPLNMQNAPNEMKTPEVYKTTSFSNEGLEYGKKYFSDPDIGKRIKTNIDEFTAESSQAFSGLVDKLDNFKNPDPEKRDLTGVANDIFDLSMMPFNAMSKTLSVVPGGEDVNKILFAVPNAVGEGIYYGTDKLFPDLDEKYKKLITNVGTVALLYGMGKVGKINTPEFRTKVMEGIKTNLPKIWDELNKPLPGMENVKTQGISFGKSKKEIEVYRGERTGEKQESKGQWFTTKPENAEWYGEVSKTKINTEKFIDLTSTEKRNELLKNTDIPEVLWDKNNAEVQNALYDEAQKLGYKGMIVKDMFFGKEDVSYVSFENLKTDKITTEGIKPEVPKVEEVKPEIAIEKLYENNLKEKSLTGELPTEPFTEDKLLNRVTPPMGEKPQTTKGYNEKTLHPDLEKSIPNILDEITEFNKIRGERLTNEQTKKASLDYATNLSDEKIIRMDRGTTMNAVELTGSRLYVEDKLLKLNDKVEKLSSEGSPINIKENTQELAKDLYMLMKVQAVGTEVARSTQSMRIRINESMIKGLEKLNVEYAKINPEHAQILSDILHDYKKANNATLKDRIFFWYYNSILSSPYTDLANVTGNVSSLGFEFMSQLLNPYAIAKGDFVPLLKGLTKGIKEGSMEAKLELKGEREVLSKFDDLDKNYFHRYSLHPKSTIGKFGNAILPTTRLGVEDAFFRKIFEGVEGEVLSNRLAKKEKISIDDVKKTMKEVMDNPTLVDSKSREYRRLYKEMKSYADYGVFQTELGKYGKAIESLSQNYFVKPIIPFVKIATNILKHGIDTTPLGLTRLLGEKAKDMSMREKEHIVRRVVAGTVLYTGIGTLIANGVMDITGHGPKDKADRDMWERQGYEPNHIYIGGKGISYQNINPFNVILGIAGNWRDDNRYNKKPKEDDYNFIQKVTSVLAGTLSTLTDQSFMQGASNFFTFIKTENPDYLTQMATNITTPNVLGTVKDTKQYITGNKPTFEADTWWESIKRKVGLNEGLKPKLDVFGEQKQNTYERFPFFPKSIGKDPTSKYLLENNLNVGYPSKTTKIDDKQMTDEQYRYYMQESGKRLYNELKSLIPQIKNKTLEEQQKEIDKTRDDIRDKVKEEMKGSKTNSKPKKLGESNNSGTKPKIKKLGE